jgi:hypothetical protein
VCVAPEVLGWQAPAVAGEGGGVGTALTWGGVGGGGC